MRPGDNSSTAPEQLGQPSSQDGSNMKCWTMSCWRSSNMSKRLAFPDGPSNVYALSTTTIGNSLLLVLKASRARVIVFSSSNSCLRAASHSSLDTISGKLIVAQLLHVADPYRTCPKFETPHRSQSHRFGPGVDERPRQPCSDASRALNPSRTAPVTESRVRRTFRR